MKQIIKIIIVLLTFFLFIHKGYLNLSAAYDGTAQNAIGQQVLILTSISYSVIGYIFIKCSFFILDNLFHLIRWSRLKKQKRIIQLNEAINEAIKEAKKK